MPIYGPYKRDNYWAVNNIVGVDKDYNMTII